MASIQSVISRSVIAQLTNSSQQLNSSILNLASGVKTNASVAELSIGTVLRNQSGTLTTANINAGQGKSLVETAKGALDQILELLQSQKSLAVQASDGSLTANEKAILNTEFQSITTEINRLATTTNFNNKNLLDGSISGTEEITSVTGQASENYTLLDADSDFTLSGTVATGDLVTASTFDIAESDTIGKTASSATIVFTAAGGINTDATVTIGGVDIDFGDGTANSIQAATAFVSAARASTSNVIRNFTFEDNGDGSVTVTSADLGTAADAINFQVTDTSGGEITAATFGGVDFISATRNTGTDGTAGTLRTVAAGDKTIDANLQGSLTNFTATLDATGTQNAATFTVDVNGTTYTSQAVTLFGDGTAGEFNGKGDTIKNGQVITFYNTAGPTDGSSEFTDNGFTLTVGASDITVVGATQTIFEANLTSIASGFTTQLDANLINQSRDIIFSQVNASGGDFDIASAVGTTFAGIEGFDAVSATNVAGDISFVGHTFGDDGKIGDIGSFAFTQSTDTLSVTIDGQTYSADLSDNTANTGGIVDGAGNYNSSTNVLTVGAGTTIVFHSASTTDGKQLRIDLSNLTDTEIDLGTTAAATIVTDDLDTLFGVANNPTLSFQVGAASSDTIAFALNSAKTTDIYLNDAGTSKTLDISTTAGATEAQEVLDNAINTALGLIATSQSNITSFNSAITTNSVMIQNFDAASSVLLDTNYVLDSTIYAESTLKVNAAIAVLAQEQTRLQSLLQLLS